MESYLAPLACAPDRRWYGNARCEDEVIVPPDHVDHADVTS